MFEKEAEEYSNNWKINKNNDLNFAELVELRAVIYKANKDGAEFGYNKAKKDADKMKSQFLELCNLKDMRIAELEKANEWHKQEVDDIYDLISKDWSIRYFICIMKDKSRITAIGNCDEGCNGEVSVNLFFEHDDEKYYIDDIAWWKEIVLPKESE